MPGCRPWSTSACQRQCRRSARRAAGPTPLPRTARAQANRPTRSSGFLGAAASQAAPNILKVEMEMAQKIRNPSIPIRPATASMAPSLIEPKTQTAAASSAKVASSMPARAKFFRRVLPCAHPRNAMRDASSPARTAAGSAARHTVPDDGHSRQGRSGRARGKSLDPEASSSR